jgi:hypothetical protein
MMAFRGVNATSPIEAGAASQQASATTYTLSSVTTTTANDLVIIFSGTGRDSDTTDTQTVSYSNSNLTGITELHDQTTSQGGGGGFGIAMGRMVTPGVVGTTTVTITQASVGSGGQFAIAPAAAAGAMTADLNDIVSIVSATLTTAITPTAALTDASSTTATLSTAIRPYRSAGGRDDPDRRAEHPNPAHRGPRGRCQYLGHPDHGHHAYGLSRRPWRACPATLTTAIRPTAAITCTSTVTASLTTAIPLAAGAE